jgi:HK97 family phage major capsid protein
MDIKSAEAEISAIQIKATALIDSAKAANRDVTDAEFKQMEADRDRVIQLKAQIIGMKNADTMAQVGSASPEFENVDGTPGAGGSQKKYFDFSADGAKAVAARLASHGVKGIVAAGSSGVATDFDSRVVPLPPRTGGATGLFSFFEVKQRESQKYEYLRQVPVTGRVDNAAVVAPGAEKPVSQYKWENVQGTLSVWAHLSEPVDKYLLEDATELETYLRAEMSDGLFRKVEAGLLSQLAAASGIQTSATSAGFTPQKGFDGVYDAIAKLGTAGNSADLVVVHADDYQVLRLARDADSRYYADGPFEGGNPGLWGVPTFVVTSGVAKGTVLVVDSSAVGISTDRSGVKIDVNPYTGFSTNQLTFRGEGRFALDVKQPKGVLKLTLTA